MIINQIDAQFQYEGVTYTIGGKVRANDASDYAGLYGTITEIRDGDDRETENSIPDIYCSFMAPILTDHIKRPVDLMLDTVIMAPEALKVLEPAPITQKLTIYIVREDWAFGGDCSEDFYLATDPDIANYILTELVHEQLAGGYVSEWTDRPDWEVECTPKCYECGLHDSYFENHYNVYIDQQELPIGDRLLDSLRKSASV